MFSPRGAEGSSSTPAPPGSTPRSAGLLGSLSKMLWSPTEGAEDGAAGSVRSPDLSNAAAQDSFMTQSPRGHASPSYGNDGLASPRGLSSPQMGGASSSSQQDAAPPTPRSSGLLDTLFSPVFTFFGTKAEGGADGSSADVSADEAAEAAAAAAVAAEAAATAAAAAAAAEAQATARARAAERQQQQQQQRRGKGRKYNKQWRGDRHGRWEHRHGSKERHGARSKALERPRVLLCVPGAAGAGGEGEG